MLAAVLGHGSVMALHGLRGEGVSSWLKGPHGPPFFDLGVYTGVFYACLAAFLAQGGRRLQGVLLGLGASAGVFLLPMAAATRFFAWGESLEIGETWAWVRLVLGLYLAACASAVWAVGANLGGPLRARARGGFWALGGALAGYGAARVVFHFFPALSGRWEGGLPTPGILADGLISGGFIAAAVAVGRRRASKEEDHA